MTCYTSEYYLESNCFPCEQQEFLYFVVVDNI
jgi:hypothetical protein